MKTDQLRATTALLLLLILASFANAQPRTVRVTITPGFMVVPGRTVRVAISPASEISSEDGERSRAIFRPVTDRDSQTDIVLPLVEYHANWFSVRIPDDAPTGATQYRLIWSTHNGVLLGSSEGMFYRINPGDQRSGRGNAQGGVVLKGTTTTGRAQRLKTPVVDYVVIEPDTFEVKGGNYPFAFTLPSDVRLNDTVVLTFSANTFELGNPFPGHDYTVLNIKINGTKIGDARLKVGDMTGCTVTFNAQILRPGRNEIAFSGAGEGIRVSVKEVVLFFHRDIP